MVSFGKKKKYNIIDVALIVLFLEQVRWYLRSRSWSYTSPTVYYLFLVSMAWGTLDILYTLVWDIQSAYIFENCLTFQTIPADPTKNYQ